MKPFYPALIILQFKLVEQALQHSINTELKTRLGELNNSCVDAGLALSATLTNDLIVTLDANPDMPADAFAGPASELWNRIVDELRAPRFMVIPLEKIPYFSNYELFGAGVRSKFAKIADDIAEAGRSYAAGRNTACVFHLMRVMEFGVQRLGKKLGIRLVGEKVWQNILDEVNKAVKGLPERTPRHKKRKAELAGIAAHLYNVKWAWRNPVMHPKSSYTEEEALDVLDHVKSFMRHLASYT